MQPEKHASLAGQHKMLTRSQGTKMDFPDIMPKKCVNFLMFDLTLSFVKLRDL